MSTIALFAHEGCNIERMSQLSDQKIGLQSEVFITRKAKQPLIICENLQYVLLLIATHSGECWCNSVICSSLLPHTHGTQSV